MSSALVLALTWAIAAPNAAAYCSVGYQRSVRPRRIMELPPAPRRIRYATTIRQMLARRGRSTRSTTVDALPGGAGALRGRGCTHRGQAITSAVRKMTWR